jgi:hypothetical protein
MGRVRNQHVADGVEGVSAAEGMQGILSPGQVMVHKHS